MKNITKNIILYTLFRRGGAWRGRWWRRRGDECWPTVTRRSHPVPFRRKISFRYWFVYAAYIVYRRIYLYWRATCAEDVSETACTKYVSESDYNRELIVPQQRSRRIAVIMKIWRAWTDAGTMYNSKTWKTLFFHAVHRILYTIEDDPPFLLHAGPYATLPLSPHWSLKVDHYKSKDL